MTDERSLRDQSSTQTIREHAGFPASATKEYDGPASTTSDAPEWSWTNRPVGFWMVIAATLTSDFLSAMDLTAISTALPTIVEDLGGSDFIWPGSAYTLAGVALVPVTGGLVSIFGRKPILLFCIACFALGSALAGAAKTLNMLIAARAIQGFASGGCIATTEIIYADLVPLPQRGIIFGIVAVMWAVASGLTCLHIIEELSIHITVEDPARR